jgi:hypothetical protein
MGCFTICGELNLREQCAFERNLSVALQMEIALWLMVRVSHDEHRVPVAEESILVLHGGAIGVEHGFAAGVGFW